MARKRNEMSSAIGIFVGLSFLWPYYQRAFYRVTLFYRMGDDVVAAYGLFLIALLLGCIVAATRYRAVEGVLQRQPALLLSAAGLSLVSALYLRGYVRAEGHLGDMLSYLAVVGYAVSFATISAGWAIALMRFVYTRGLFQGVAMLGSTAMAAKLISPTSAAVDSVFGLVPVMGLALSGGAVFAVSRWEAGGPSMPYEKVGEAPYLREWLIPVAAYGVFSVSHAIRYAFDMTNEVSVAGGEIVPASPSYSFTLTFLLFAALLSGAALHSSRRGVPGVNRLAFWIASLGVAIGLLAAPMLSLLAAEDDSFASMDAGTGCITLLVCVCVLLLTYQNRLSPLQTFSLFWCLPIVVEKIIAYLVAPLVLGLAGEAAASWARPVIMFSFAATLVTLLLFLMQLCRGNALGLLFPASSPTGGDDGRDGRRAACSAIGARSDLSDREVELLYYLSYGYSAKKTGETLFISERTVQTHTQNIYRKLDVHSKQAIIDLVEKERALK
ncbi:helix-turn-helix domain-containing protein [uncultured Adlercreutzia sp.]|uniref:helix-turn-helix transcriptional regulator n=1 Tax=uncultured Adlercreutzia sp. TaxID=875803 RepID=UPI00267676AA|nr:helix-turn-helix domain-containing protein [uncultured Adlercreutzia sp.]